MEEVRPTLSLQERDRRWALARNLMKEQGFECMIVVGLNSREQYDGYFTNDYAQGIVVLPKEGEPTYLVWTSSRLTRHMESLKREGTSWVSDYRVGATGPGLVAILKEKGFDSAPIGVLGLESRVAGEIEGCMPYKTWSYVLDHLPKASFADISRTFSELILAKSEEELALVRYSAQVGEMACEAMLKAAGPGVSESEIYAAIMKVIFENGLGVPYQMLLLHSGVDNASWGPPTWIHKAQSPPLLQAGDMVQAELFPRYGGLETQQQMSVSLKPVHPVNQECAEAGRASYEVGIKAISPGKTLREVAEAMAVPVREAGCWHLTSLIHTLNPLMTVFAGDASLNKIPGIEKYKTLQTPDSPQPGKDILIKPGMVFELEPNPCHGMHRVNIGGTVIVTEEGVEELNKLPTEMQVV